MTKRVISILVLIVFSIVMGTSVFAAYVGTAGKNFNLVFNRYEEGTILIAFTDMKNNTIDNNVFTPSLVKELRDAQCKIAVTTNTYSQLKVTFNLFKNTNTNVDSSFSYTVQLYEANDDSTPMTNYKALKVDSDGTTGGTFYTGNQYGENETYKYNLAFQFSSDDLNSAIPGTYQALIVVEVISTE